MKFDFGAIFEQVVGFYIKLPFAQKIALRLLAAGCMSLIIFVSHWATEPEWGKYFIQTYQRLMPAGLLRNSRVTTNLVPD